MAREAAGRASRVARLHARALHAVRHDQVVVAVACRSRVVNHESIRSIRVMPAATARHEIVTATSTAVTRLRPILLVLIMIEAEGCRGTRRRRRSVSVYRMVARRLLREYRVDFTGLSLVQVSSRSLHAVRIIRRFKRLVRTRSRVGGARGTVVGALDGQLVLARTTHH